jgi:NTP pyrophosphatase (non-canonical NTP hydrolase)
MNLNNYQKKAMETVVFPKEYSLIYPALGLVNEAGEYAGKVKKILRGDAGAIKEAAAAELGDVLWYLAACAEALGTDLSIIAQQNLDKLADRAARGVLKGSGDNR